MTGATGSIYLGLPEFEQMSFLLHYLRQGDTFIDVGANVGSYTILASGVSGAQTIAFEPAQSEYDALIANVRLNTLDSLVDPRKLAVGDRIGEVSFFDKGVSGCRIISDGNGGVKTPISTLDAVIKEAKVRLIKIELIPSASSNQIICFTREASKRLKTE
jgi:FkbM family methyltransferase